MDIALSETSTNLLSGEAQIINDRYKVISLFVFT